MQKITCVLLKCIAVLALTVGVNSVTTIPVFAQDPVVWQDRATGLSVNQNSEKITAGLGFIVGAADWPSLSLRGGVEDGGWNRVAGPIGIELGRIKIPNSQSITLSSEVTDWAHNELTFDVVPGNQLKLWVSRLSPAIVAQSSSDRIRLLAGNVTGNILNNSKISERLATPAYPKYMAYKSGGQFYIQSLSTSDFVLPNLDQNWVLVWYGDNSHFVETKMPTTYGGWTMATSSVPQIYAYQADAPLLLLFENQPQAIKHSHEGGVEVSFQSPAGYISVLPLFGRDHPASAETETWFQELPNAVAQRAQWWAERLCAYPTTVRETYSYEEATETTHITEDISTLQICSGGTTFAPVPPMLGLAKDSLGVTFSAAVVDGNIATEFGPILGVENTTQYTWSISGLQGYVDARRTISNLTSPPAELQEELVTQVDKIVAAGHFTPWLFMDAIPPHTVRGDIYWLNPADILYHLVEIVPALPTDQQIDLINYLKSERASYPPELNANLPLDEGTARQNFEERNSTIVGTWQNNRRDLYSSTVPIYNFYALARYYEFTGEPLPPAVLQAAKEALNRDMSEQDWATFYWFEGHQDRAIAVVNANRHFAGLIGFITLAKLSGDQDAEKLGRALLAKAAVLRLGMAHYPRYLYAADLTDLPSEPDWQPRYTAGNWMGHLYNYDWTGPYDDPRQVVILDQFQVYLFDQSGLFEGWGTPSSGGDFNKGPTSSHLIAFKDMVPEMAKFLTDYARSDVEVYANKVEALNPHWYAAFAEGMLGGEHNLSHPIDSFQIFMAKALIQQEPPDQLARYADIPWLEAGDLFYAHKLAETIKAYRGYSWE